MKPPKKRHPLRRNGEVGQAAPLAPLDVQARGRGKYYMKEQGFTEDEDVMEGLLAADRIQALAMGQAPPGRNSRLGRNWYDTSDFVGDLLTIGRGGRAAQAANERGERTDRQQRARTAINSDMGGWGENALRVLCREDGDVYAKVRKPGVKRNPALPVKAGNFYSPAVHRSGWRYYRLVQRRDDGALDRSMTFYAPDDDAARAYVPKVLFDGSRPVRLERSLATDHEQAAAEWKRKYVGSRNPAKGRKQNPLHLPKKHAARRNPSREQKASYWARRTLHAPWGKVRISGSPASGFTAEMTAVNGTKESVTGLPSLGVAVETAGRMLGLRVSPPIPSSRSRP